MNILSEFVVTAMLFFNFFMFCELYVVDMDVVV